jgi:O-antigen ligase
MAAPLGETPAAVVLAEDPSAAVAGPVSRPAAARRWPAVATLPYGLYWAHVVALFGLAGSNVLLGLAVLTAPLSGGSRGLGRRACRPLLLVVALYVALLGLSVVTSFDPPRSARSLSELFALCTLLAGLALVRDERAVRGMVDAVVLLATGEAVVGLVQLVAAGGPDLAHRIQGTFSHYMTFSGILMIADLVLLARLVARGRESGWRAWALVPINAALVATLTRSAWVGLAVGLAVLLLLGRRRLLLWWVPAALLLLLLLPPAVLDRAASIVDPGDPTNSDRLCMARAGAAMIRERPLVGQGPDMVEVRYPLYRMPDATRKWVPHLHDAFLEVAAERGLPALVALLLLLGVPAGRALADYRREGGRSGPRADLWLAVLGGLVGFAVAGLFEDNWGDVEVQRLVLVLLAIPYGLALKDEPASRPTRLPSP